MSDHEENLDHWYVEVRPIVDAAIELIDGEPFAYERLEATVQAKAVQIHSMHNDYAEAKVEADRLRAELAKYKRAVEAVLADPLDDDWHVENVVKPRIHAAINEALETE